MTGQLRHPDEIARIALAELPLSQAAYQAQLVQSRHRAEIALAWDIRPEQRVLELGCGQGDMTAVLAAMVGETGHVSAVDPGSPDYGAPLSLGEAIANLISGPLGTRIDVQLGKDLEAAGPMLPLTSYDAAVLAHCSWYFDTREKLAATLEKLAQRTDRLLLSEWDIRAETPAQIPHLLTVLLRRALAVPLSDDNIRSPLSKAEMLEVLAETGWIVDAIHAIDSRNLQDGGWEVDMMMTRLLSDPALGSAGLMADGDLEQLRDTLLKSAVESMASHAIICHR